MAVASPAAAQVMERECDALVCLNVPSSFYSVGQYFDDFSQVTDNDVVRVLSQKSQQAAGTA